MTGTRQRLTLVLSLGIGTLSLALAGCGGTPGSSQAAAQATITQAHPTAAATAAATGGKQWVTLQHFTGNQDTQTATFTVKSGMRVVWTAKPTETGPGSGGYFSIEALNASDSSSIGQLASTNVHQTETGTTIAHQDHEMYLKVTAIACSYDIAVQEYR